MKTAMLGAALAAVTFASCSSLSTDFDYDTSFDFAGLHTYAWIDKQDNSLDMKRVREAVDATLRARGFQPTESRPDFQVAAHVSTKDRLRVVDWGYTYHPRGYWYGGRDVDVYQYEEGTLILDVIDPGQSELIWRGTASKTIDRGWTPLERDEEAREAVRALLEKFPPKRGG